MTKPEELPKVVSEGVLDIGGFKIRTYVLDNGKRLMNADDVHGFFGSIANNVDDDQPNGRGE